MALLMGLLWDYYGIAAGLRRGCYGIATRFITDDRAIGPRFPQVDGAARSSTLRAHVITM